MTAQDDMNNKTLVAPDRTAIVWLGIAVGVAVGVGIAISRRKKNPWEKARALSHQVADNSGEIAEATRELAGRVGHIYEETCKVLEGATFLWAKGRKLVGN